MVEKKLCLVVYLTSGQNAVLNPSSPEKCKEYVEGLIKAINGEVTAFQMIEDTIWKTSMVLHPKLVAGFQVFEYENYEKELMKQHLKHLKSGDEWKEE